MTVAESVSPTPGFDQRAVVTVAELVDRVAARLSAAGVPSPRVDARLLVLAAARWSPADLALRGAEPVAASVADAVRSLADRRAAREPLQLLLGAVGFRTVELEVRPGVFVPRPETEVLAGLAIDRLPAGGAVAEPCAGTGAVACAIAAERPDATVLASDADPAAAALAAANAARLGLSVTVTRARLLDAVPDALRGTVDVVVSNPPYLADDELDGLEPEVGRDPRHALVAGSTGHEVSDALIAAAGSVLAPGGWLLLELDERRVDEAAARATAGGLADAAVEPDLTGRPRFLLARRPV